MSSEAYSELLALITDHNCSIPYSTSDGSVPGIETIYLEAIDTHVKASLYEQPLTLCNNFLSRVGWSDENSLPDLEREGRPDNRPSSKRLRGVCLSDPANQSTSNLTSMEFTAAKIALCRCHVLIELGRNEEALSYIER